MLKQRLNQVCQVINALGGWSPIFTYKYSVICESIRIVMVF